MKTCNCFLFGAMLFLSVFLSRPSIPNSFATEKSGQSAAAYGSLTEIPEVMREKLRYAKYREKFISQTLRAIRRLPSKTYISKEQLEAHKARQILQRRRNQVMQWIRRDLNLDGRITLEEIRRNRRSRYTDKQFKALDRNSDGVLTFSEIAKLDDKALQRMERNYRRREAARFLPLDPNGDGRLTIEELRRIAGASFDAADQDRDGVLSRDEKKQLRKIRPRRTVRRQPSRRQVSKHQAKRILTRPKELVRKKPLSLSPIKPDEPIPDLSVIQPEGKEACIAPYLKSSEKLVALRVVRGASLTNLTDNNSSFSVTSTTIDVKRGAPPLNLVLSSKGAMIWRFKGEVSAIKRLVIGNSRSGVAGIRKGRITFLPERCVQSFVDAKSALAHKRKAQVAGEIIIDNSGVTFSPLSRARRPVRPIGYEAQLWPLVLKDYPLGIETIPPHEFIASNINYKNLRLMPGLAGVSQLVYSRHLKIVSAGKGSQDTFRVLKDIADFPIGFGGLRTVKLVVPRGKRVGVRGLRGVCVVEDGSMKVLHGGGVCRGVKQAGR